MIQLISLTGTNRSRTMAKVIVMLEGAESRDLLSAGRDLEKSVPWEERAGVFIIFVNAKSGVREGLGVHLKGANERVNRLDVSWPPSSPLSPPPPSLLPPPPRNPRDSAVFCERASRGCAISPALARPNRDGNNCLFHEDPCRFFEKTVVPDRPIDVHASCKGRAGGGRVVNAILMPAR